MPADLHLRYFWFCETDNKAGVKYSQFTWCVRLLYTYIIVTAEGKLAQISFMLSFLR